MKYLLILLSLSTCILLQAQDDQQVIIERESSLTKEVQVEEENGMLNVRIVTTDQDGNQEVMVWKGSKDDPDMPEDIKVYIVDGENEDGKQARVEKKKHMRIKVLDDEGNEKILEWDGEGEMPAEIKQLMNENGYKMTQEDRDRRRSEMKDRHMEYRKERAEGEPKYGPKAEVKGKKKGRRHENKPKLGVLINDDMGTVSIEEVMVNSAAAKGGMLPDDIITKVDDTEIDSLDRLYSELGTHNTGDKVKVWVKRGSKTKKLSIILD